jgi:GNAT superfamily N-acetyltransferase
MSDALRIATPDDFQEIFRICCLLHAENGQHPFNELKVRQIIWRGVNRWGALCAVIGSPADIKAMILLTIEEVYYSDAHEIVERWAYVRPDCRRTDYAKQLIGFAKKCADETGLSLSIGIISDDRLAAKRRLYERSLPLGGYWFTYRPRLAAVQAA